MAAALAAYGVCQTGCNGVWVTCCAALGFTAGTFTGGTALPAALASCSVNQGTCMAACAVTAGLAGAAEAGAAGAAVGGAGSVLAGVAGVVAAAMAAAGSVAAYLGLVVKAAPTIPSRVITAASDAVATLADASASLASSVYDAGLFAANAALALLIAYALFRLLILRG
jgi:hypothetical protein